MTQFDRFGAPVSHTVQCDVDGFGAAAELMLAYAPDPITLIKEVLDNAPDFIMARCFLAGIYLVASDKRRFPLLMEHYKILRNLNQDANSRERGHIHAIGLWVSGDFYAASQAYADILSDCPRDIVALQIGHQTDFLLGQASSTRDRPARMIDHWSEDDAQFSYILGMQAFGLEECGHYPQAQAAAERCVAINPYDAWGVHALAHCFEMQGKIDEGIGFMQRSEGYWGTDNYMSIHNRWHFSLYYMERCEFDHVLTLHDEYMQVDNSSQLMDMHDSAALLWRLSLFGQDVGNRWEVVADRYAEVLDQAYMAFTDIHGMMAFTATAREDDAALQIEALERATQYNTTNSKVIQQVGLPLVKGFQAFGREDFASAKSYLSIARHHSHVIGGSIAQRDIINLTLLEAARRDADKGMANALLAERRVIKPPSPLTNLLSE